MDVTIINYSNNNNNRNERLRYFYDWFNRVFLQWVFGLVTFLLPGLSDSIKSLYKPIHVFWGVAIFVLAIATALMGINEKLIFSNT